MMSGMIFKAGIFLFSALTLSGCGGKNTSGRQTTHGQSTQEQDENSPKSLYKIAQTLQKARDYEAAANLYQQILEKDPNHVMAQVSLGQTLSAMGRHKEAIQTLERLSRTHPENPMVLRELGRGYIEANMAAEGIGVFEKLLVYAPRDTTALNGLGVCYDLREDHASAQEWYRRALAVNPDHLGARSNLGLSLVFDGKVQEGIVVLGKIVDGPTATSKDRQNLAIAYGMAGELEKSAQIFSIDLDEHAVRNNLAYVHQLYELHKHRMHSQTRPVAAQSVPTLAALTPLQDSPQESDIVVEKLSLVAIDASQADPSTSEILDVFMPLPSKLPHRKVRGLENSHPTSPQMVRIVPERKPLNSADTHQSKQENTSNTLAVVDTPQAPVSIQDEVSRMPEKPAEETGFIA